MLLEDTGREPMDADNVASDDRSIPAAITDTGCERELNEDRYAVIESPSGLAWLVCDGMGGQAGGELAAQLAIDGIRRNLENLPPRPSTAAIKAAVLEANRIIVLRRQNPAFAQMGTTVTGLLFSGIEVALANVGDSRGYLVRNGAIEQLSTDHTFVQELVSSGQITHEEAMSHPQAHILTRAIGSEPGLRVDVSRFWIWETPPGEVGDILLLCSDGLYSHVADDEIAQHVTHYTPHEACVKLVDLAKERGGFDNITVAVIPIGGQLRDSAPEGFDEATALEMLRQKSQPEAAPVVKKKSNWLKSVTTVAVFSLLAVAIVVAWVMFSLVE